MGKKSRKRRGQRSARTEIPFSPPPGYEDPHPAFSEFTGIPSMKVDVQVVRLLLGFQPVGTTTDDQTVGFVDIVDGNDDLRAYWKRASAEDKQQVLAVEPEAVYTILNTLRKLKVRYKQLQPETIKGIQAKFLLAMERQATEKEPQPPPEMEEPAANGVYVNLVDPSVEELAAMYILKENLALKYTQDLIHRDFASVLLYASWTATSTWYYGLVALFVVTYGIGSSVEVIQSFRRMLKQFVDTAFASNKDASYVQWKAESFICGALLVTMASDTKYYIFICILIAAPYVFGFLEDSVFTGMVDEKNFRRLRQLLSWLNKGMLVFFAYTSYASSILVASLFFHNLTYNLLGLVVSVAASAVLRVFGLAFGFVPEHKQQAIFRWIDAHATPVTILVFAMNVAAIYYSWDWSTLWGGSFRVAFAGLTILTVPMNHISMILEVSSALLFLPFSALDNALKALLFKWGLDSGGESGQTPQDSRETFFEESRRRQAESY